MKYLPNLILFFFAFFDNYAARDKITKTIIPNVFHGWITSHSLKMSLDEATINWKLQ